MLKSKVLYLIFGDSRNQDNDDLEDLCQNIKKFDEDCDIIINHPTATHPLVKLNHTVHPVNTSTFIFGVFIEFLKYLKYNTTEFDHVCLFSANQYMINSFHPEIGVNYLQFYNHPYWDYIYNGKDFSNLTIGNPLIQYESFNWDEKNMHEILDVPFAMVSNWEFAFLTKEAIELCQKYLIDCEKIYPNRDCIQLFPGYMALKTGQPWMFPPFFGTFDPSNRVNGHNQIITKEQIDQKFKEGYSSIKRVNYKKDCPLKEYIRRTIIS